MNKNVKCIDFKWYLEVEALSCDTHFVCPFVCTQIKNHLQNLM